jgi:hypothetical protein
LSIMPKAIPASCPTAHPVSARCPPDCRIAQKRWRKRLISRTCPGSGIGAHRMKP